MSLLEVRDLDKHFKSLGKPLVTALEGVSFDVPAGTITGLVGESGSGKSTTVRLILGLEKPDGGAITYDGTRIDAADRTLRARLHREIQVVFQDPTGSLNPRMTAGQLIGEGLIVHGLASGKAAVRTRAGELMELVGLDVRDIDRHPRSFSGGQRQRIAIARALAVEPQLLICDEAVSALDVSVQAQILNLILDMRDRLGLTVLFVAHDLAVVRQVCTRVVVMERGRVVEEGDVANVFDSPQAEYTRELLAAAPLPDPVRARERLAQRRGHGAEALAGDAVAADPVDA